MPTVSSIDKFIELSTDLLINYPTTTTLSITYTNFSKKSSSSSNSNSKSNTNKSSSTHGVNFKLYEPNLGKVIKYNTKKSKELSKLLNFIGPKGLNNDNLHVLGLASLMTNVKYEDNTTIQNQSLENTPAPVELDAVSTSANANANTVKVEEKPGSSSTTTGGGSSSKKKNKKKKKKN